ncbi:lytic transglycosylase domain-containing protein [Saccharospirillum salsuginis]|uniref:Lytic transglycosylase n=1 Tax=Saccharospirillum salsuginis TaxID=418750 RepID=A0A918NAL1_9GAMM|nr:lytic transglycosylase domain-containing protein [Saccharospirillum salsuginis]GGX53540.1 lytic transglycosylase [Saccharospirillum salsuginis]
MKPFIVLLLSSCLPWFTQASSLNYEHAVSRIEEKAFPFEELEEWTDHLLYPHLVTHWVENNLEQVDADWFTPLLSREEFEAAGWYTRHQWLAELARREAWRDYLEFARLSDIEGALCQTMAAEEKLGGTVSSAGLRTLWLTGDSLPENCDPFLARVQSLSDFDDLVWQRQLLAFEHRNGGLVRYLSGLYRNPEFKVRGERLRDVYNDPGSLLKATYRPSEAWQRELALATIDRMAYLDPERASNIWVQVIQATPELTIADIRSVSAHLGEAMAKLALPAADYWLSLADPKQTNDDLQHWRLQIALASGDWPKVSHLYDGLDPSIRASGQWRYWRAMALRQTGEPDAADSLLAPLARERSYYGFLAAEALNRPIELDAEPIPPLDTRQSPLLAEAGLQRAKALFEAGDITRAQLEWNLTGRSFDRDQWLEAAVIAQSWQWHHKASQSAAWSGRYGALDLRYPTPWREQVGQLEQSLNVPSYWIYGVIRQESHFMTDAESRVGALGLMQLMPYTARQIADEHTLAFQEEWDLTNPDLNLELGTRYLGMMMERFGHPVYATAAYNAGPSRVDRWLKRYPGDLRVWIESIPFDETRGYVKSVLAYAQVYAARDRSEWRLAQWLEPDQVAFGQ